MFGVYQENAPQVNDQSGIFTANLGRLPFINFKGAVNALINLNPDLEKSGTDAVNPIPFNWNNISFRTGFVSNLAQTFEQKIDGRAFCFTGNDPKDNIAAWLTGSFLNNAYCARTVINKVWPGWNGMGRPYRAQWIFHRPDLVLDIGSTGGFGAAGQGNTFDGHSDFGTTPYKIPYLRNLQTITLIGDGRFAQRYYITSIVGVFPPSVHTITIVMSVDLVSIEKPFPKNLKRLALETPNAGLLADLPRLMSDIDNDSLEEFCLTRPNDFPSVAVNFVGVLDLSRFKNLKRLQLRTNTITNILLHPEVSGIDQLIIISAFSLPNALKMQFINLFQSSTNQTLLNIPDLRAIGQLNISNQNHPNFRGLILHINRLEGSIDLSSPFTASVLQLGESNALSRTNPAHWKNNFHTVDLSGLQNDVATLDITNCDIQNLNLPVNRILTNFFFGGNRLGINNDPTILQKLINACRLNTLQFFRASINIAFDFPNKYPLEFGQENPSGLGHNTDFSMFTNLRELQLQGCGLTGTITLPTHNLISAIILNQNNLTEITGTNVFAGVNNFQIRFNPNLNVDLTRFPALSFIRIQGNDTMTFFDLRQRTAVTDWNQNLFLGGNSVLQEILFPENTDNFTFANANVVFGFDFCPELEFLTNFDKWDFRVAGVVNRTAQFSASGSPKLAKRYIQLNHFPEIPPAYAWSLIQFENCNLTDAEMGVIIDWYWNERETLWFKFAGTFNLRLRNNAEPLQGLNNFPAGYRYNAIASITRGPVTRVTLTNAGATLNLLENDEVTFLRGHGAVNGDRGWANLIHGQKFVLKNRNDFTFDVFLEDGITPFNTSTGFPTGYVSNSAVFVKYGDDPVNNRQKLNILSHVLPLWFLV